MDISNFIQVLIALIMLATTLISVYFSNKTLKHTDKTQKNILSNEIIKLESETLEKLFSRFENEKNFIIHDEELKNIDKEFALRYLNLYNYIAALFNQNKIDEDLFYSVFLNSFEQAYEVFMIFENKEVRINEYKDLCKYYNSLNLSIIYFGEIK